jgi:hypothetical protein
MRAELINVSEDLYIKNAQKSLELFNKAREETNCIRLPGVLGHVYLVTAMGVSALNLIVKVVCLYPVAIIRIPYELFVKDMKGSRFLYNCHRLLYLDLAYLGSECVTTAIKMVSLVIGILNPKTGLKGWIVAEKIDLYMLSLFSSLKFDKLGIKDFTDTYYGIQPTSANVYLGVVEAGLANGLTDEDKKKYTDSLKEHISYYFKKINTAKFQSYHDKIAPNFTNIEYKELEAITELYFANIKPLSLISWLKSGLSLKDYKAMKEVTKQERLEMKKIIHLSKFGCVKTAEPYPQV